MSIPAASFSIPNGVDTFDPADQLAARLRTDYANRITGELVMPATSGRYRPLPATLDPRMTDALHSR
ncbi:MAG: hypothetical protein KZQ79_07895, partial [Candidatus Thiodiazotropha sp. (ex Lucinoma borealis)]|nr:hypothetical protein [Candidatus Thiodiazotropha sp. (ex Lucinoma borealis)]